MFEDYKKAILDFYQKLKDMRRLSTNLESHRRERLRRECVVVFSRKNTEKDKSFIRSFFDPANRHDDLVRSIERFNLDKFRPLISFLVDGTGIRDDHSVKLLAWLIDFPTYEVWRELDETERKKLLEIEEAIDEPNVIEEVKQDSVEEIPRDEPMDSKGGLDKTDDISLPDDVEKEDKTYIVIDKEKGDIPPQSPSIIRFISDPNHTSSLDGKEEDKTDPTILIEKESIPSKSPLSIGSILIISIGCLLIGYASFIAWENSSISIRVPDNGEDCMYWKDDHYEPINCNLSISGAMIIPLNLEKLHHLKKINLPDTLTKNSIGKVWYTGRGGNNEYFTDSGMHPVDTAKKLKPFSSYIQTSYSSYPRYLLTRTIWLIGGIVTLLILFGVYILFWKKRKKANVQPQ